MFLKTVIRKNFKNQFKYSTLVTSAHKTKVTITSSKTDINLRFPTEQDSNLKATQLMNKMGESQSYINDKSVSNDSLGSNSSSGPDSNDLNLEIASPLSEYDLKSSTSPDPTTFKSLEEQITYELEKCIGKMPQSYKEEPQHQQQQEQSDQSLTGSKSPNNGSSYTFLTAKNAINLINKREYTLVSIDNEFFEKSTSKVIEIGISIYNPTYQKFALFPHFLNIHFIIKEFINLRNGLYVPDAKMKNITGQSIIISKNDIPRAMSLIFQHLGPKVCVVGHNVSSDLSSFKYLNYNVPSSIEVIDTMLLWYSLVGSKNAKSALSFILDKLNIPSAFLHNGVNDAYYTLVVCLMLSSPELRNNLVFRKKISSAAKNIEATPDEATKTANNEVPTKKDEMPDFSMYPPQEAEIKKKRWLRKAKKAEEKLKKKAKENVSVLDTIKFRCSMDESIIATKGKGSDIKGARRPKHPTLNSFFKPAYYEEDKLTSKLNELDV